MKSIVKILVISLSFAYFTFVHAETINESSVKKLLTKLDQAISTKSASAVAPLINEKAELSGTIINSGKPQFYSLNKAQYIATLKEAWAQATQYTYRRSHEDIVIAGKSATVTADVFESMTIKGKEISTQSTEVSTVESVGGKILITKIVANGTLSGQ